MVGNSLSLVSAEKDSIDYFVWVCELQTSKHGCKIKTDRYFGCQIEGVSHDLSDGQGKIENHILDFVQKIDAFKFDILLYIDIFAVAFGKFRCYNTSLNA